MTNADITGSTEAPTNRFGEETDEVLLLYMADQAEGPQDAQEAWEEFYGRHLDYVLYICRLVCRGRLDDDLIEGVAIDVFRKVYLSAGQYDMTNEDDQVSICRRVRAWLGVIARHATIDCVRDRRTNSAILLSPEESARLDDRKQGRMSSSTQAVRKMMEEVLDERERAVLWATYLHYDPGKENQRLPNDVTQDICNALETTPANLRQIRKRATAKMKTALMDAGYTK